MSGVLGLLPPDKGPAHTQDRKRHVTCIAVWEDCESSMSDAAGEGRPVKELRKVLIMLTWLSE